MKVQKLVSYLTMSDQVYTEALETCCAYMGLDPVGTDAELKSRIDGFNEAWMQKIMKLGLDTRPLSD